MPPHVLSSNVIADYIRETLLLDASAPIGGTTPLISSGLLDSYSIVELIVHIETCYGVTVPPSLRTREHFETVERIVTVVERLRRVAG